jgi:hypothetical protein
LENVINITYTHLGMGCANYKIILNEPIKIKASVRERIKQTKIQ